MKSRLRHPIRSLKEPFGKAGLTVAILALVLAMVGGAYAAGGLTKSQEKQVTKIAKKYAGKPGAAGANGTNGTNGAAGKEGPQGKPGDPGKAGVDGKSVTVTQLTAPECNGQGGAKFTVGAEEAEACNGETGFTEALPEGKTEKGAWAGSYRASGPGEAVRLPISFNIPLLLRPLAEYAPAPTANCPGSANAPTAEPGYLCVYPTLTENVTLVGLLNLESIIDTAHAAKFGTAVAFETQAGGEAQMLGSWAVTELE